MLSGLPLGVPNHRLAYSFHGWDKSLGGGTRASAQPLVLSRSGGTAGGVEQEPKCPSQDASLAKASRRGTAGPGRTLETKVSSDSNPKETLAPGPSTLPYTLLLPRSCSRAPSCQHLLRASSDHVSSTPMSHAQLESQSQSTRGYGDLQLCLHGALSKEARPSLKAWKPLEDPIQPVLCSHLWVLETRIRPGTQ